MKIQEISEQELHNIRNDWARNVAFQKAIRSMDPAFGKACNDKDVPTAFEVLCQNQEILLDDEKFVYFLDFSHVMDINIGYRYGNLPPDYRIILSNSLQEMHISSPGNAFEMDYNRVLDALIVLCKRIVSKLEQKNIGNYEEKIKWFTNIINGRPQSFDEGIQRVLFLNQVLWQTDHRLVGLGLFDRYMNDLYEQDLEKHGDAFKSKAEASLESMLQILHRNYKYKSNLLFGDTGQIFVVGGTDLDGNYWYNDISLMLIRAIQKLQTPDPKVLLRVNSKTPDEVWQTAIECMATGVGTPLLSNDDVVIGRLENFGVPSEDAVNYATAACWEPLVFGKSSSLNNMTSLNYMKGLDYLFRRENLSLIDSFDGFFAKYLEYLDRNLNAVMRYVRHAVYQYDPVLSVFISGCREKGQDISQGGAEYQNAGITTTGLSNVVNSLINIKQYVFENQEYSLIEVKDLILNDFSANPRLPEQLRSRDKDYGSDDEWVIQITKEILQHTTERTNSFRTYLGGRLKFGVSAPSYIDAAKDFDASFDGRRFGEPFGVHISNENAGSYTEVLNFAASLDYGENRFNGNVIDFMVSPSFIEKNLSKFKYMLMAAVKEGIFQLQINVASSDVLIDAKRNPDRHKDLIVRVWGFSAFFVDLPEEYQDLLIRRALQNEKRDAA